MGIANAQADCSRHVASLRPPFLNSHNTLLPDQTTEGKSPDELAKMKPAPLSTGLRTDGTTARLGGVPAGAHLYSTSGALLVSPLKASASRSCVHPCASGCFHSCSVAS